MEEKTYLIVSIVFAVIVIIFIAIYFGYKRYKENRIYKAGKNGEKQVQHMLHKIAKKNHYQVLNDIYLPLYEESTQIDHIVIGNFGIAVLETKNLGGEIYGTGKDKNWTQILKEERKTFYNPLLQNKTHIDCVQHLLQKEKIYKVPVESLVVFTNPHCELNIDRGNPIITIDLLKKYFKKPQFKKDVGVDVQKVADALLSYQLTGRDIKEKHKEFVKKVSRK